MNQSVNTRYINRYIDYVFFLGGAEANRWNWPCWVILSPMCKIQALHRDVFILSHTLRLQRALDMEGSNTLAFDDPIFSRIARSNYLAFQTAHVWNGASHQSVTSPLMIFVSRSEMYWRGWDVGCQEILSYELQHLMRCHWDPLSNWDLLIHFTGLQQIQDDPVSEVKIPWTLRAPSIPSWRSPCAPCCEQLEWRPATRRRRSATSAKRSNITNLSWKTSLRPQPARSHPLNIYCPKWKPKINKNSVECFFRRPNPPGGGFVPHSAGRMWRTTCRVP